MKTIKFISALVILFGLSACGGMNTTLKSNKAESFNKPADKVYFILRSGNNAVDFLSQLGQAMKTEFAKRNVQAEFHVCKPLALETEKSIFETAAATQPDLIFVVTQTESFTINSTKTGVTFDIKAFEPNSASPVWRGNLDANGWISYYETDKRCAKKLVERLVEENIVQ